MQASEWGAPQQSAVSFAMDDPEDAVPYGSALVDDPGSADGWFQSTENPMATGAFLAPTFSAASATTEGPESALAELARKTGDNEESIASMGDEELFELMMRGNTGVLLRNRVLAEVEAAREKREGKNKSAGQANQAGGQEQDLEQREAQLAEVRNQLEALRPAHEARKRFYGSPRFLQANKLWLNVLFWLGAIAMWTWLGSIHYGGIYMMRARAASTDEAFVHYARLHQSVANSQSLPIHGPFGAHGGVETESRRRRRSLMKAAPPPPPSPSFELHKTWALPAHTAVQVDFRLWVFGSWDGEMVHVNVDGSEVLNVEGIYMYLSPTLTQSLPTGVRVQLFWSLVPRYERHTLTNHYPLPCRWKVIEMRD
eukprot:COSAG05_NODE_331_length_11273_cov_3.896635_14_plen_370_part_00